MSKRNNSRTDRESREPENDNQIQKIYVKKLPSSRYELKKAIAVSVTRDKDTSIARYEKIDSFGLGKSTDEAIDDLLSELCDIYHDLETNQQTLGSVSTQWWYHLKQIIKQNAND